MTSVAIPSKAALLRTGSKPARAVTLQHIVYMVGWGLAAGSLWYLALGIGVGHLTIDPAPKHQPVQHRAPRTV